MTRRKQKKESEWAAANRKTRIDKLIAVGWIKSETEIPPEAIPVDPDLINLGGSWDHPACFRDVRFDCKDCGKHQIWQAEDQRWYYEIIGAPYYSTASRCQECRQKERTRKEAARISAGHAKPGTTA